VVPTVWRGTLKARAFKDDTPVASEAIPERRVVGLSWQESPMGKRKLHSLIDKVYALPNLLLAWEKVRANRGAGGVDGQSIRQFEARLVDNLQELHRVLKEGKYQPLPVRRVYIPKADEVGEPDAGKPLVRFDEGAEMVTSPPTLFECAKPRPRLERAP
jgi:hypothetical protein